MARTHKWTVHEAAGEPKFFTHNGHFGANPNKVSKNGCGKFNWGKDGDELQDDEMAMEDPLKRCGRRNSNHNANEQELRDVNERCEELLH